MLPALSLVPYAHSALKGAVTGLAYNRSRDNEIAISQGREHFVTWLETSMQLELALTVINRALTAVGRPLNEHLISYPAMAVTAAISYLAARNLKNLYLRRFVNLLEASVGPLSFALLLSGNSALFSLGQRVEATTSIVFLSLGFLDRQHLFSDKTHNYIIKFSWIFSRVGGVCYQTGFNRLCCVVDLVMSASKPILLLKNRLLGQKESVNPNATEEKFTYPAEPAIHVRLNNVMAVASHTFCALNLSHLNPAPLPPIDESIDIDKFNQLFDTIDWTKHTTALKKKLNKDDRWKELYATPESDLFVSIATSFLDLFLKLAKNCHLPYLQSKIEGLKRKIASKTPLEGKELEFLKTNLRDFVSSIKDRKILQGRPQNYDLILKYCQFIADGLELEDEIIQADTLMRLGIEGGNYCGSGKFEVVEELYQAKLGSSDKLTLQTRVLATLQNARVVRVQNIYKFVFGNSLAQHFTKDNDIHHMNTFIQLFGFAEKFGLPQMTLVNDGTVEKDFAGDVVAAIYKNFREKFWNGGTGVKANWIFKKSWKPWQWLTKQIAVVTFSPYNQDGIIEDLNAVIGSPSLPTIEIYNWWLQWIERQPDIDLNIKDAMSDNLINYPSMLLGKPFEIDGKINPHFLIPMLQEMGILGKASVR
jgi:hypothetical protein